jgi:hypothetical protein
LPPSVFAGYISEVPTQLNNSFGFPILVEFPLAKTIPYISIFDFNLKSLQVSSLQNKQKLKG